MFIIPNRVSHCPEVADSTVGPPGAVCQSVLGHGTEPEVAPGGQLALCCCHQCMNG